MISEMSLDLFDDIFADAFEEGSPLSSSSLSTSGGVGSNNSISSLAAIDDDAFSCDSGHGSPGSGSFSSLSRSPTAAWESNSVGMWDNNLDDNAWGSILDDLPDELSDTDPIDMMLSPPQHTDILSNEQKVETHVNNDDVQMVKGDFYETMSTAEILNNIINEDKVMPAPPKVPVTPTSPVSVVKVGMKMNSFPLVLKQIDSNTAQNVKSHIKIGNNIFAIMQGDIKINPTAESETKAPKASFQHNIDSPVACEKTFPSNQPKKSPKAVTDDHDYSTGFTGGTTGVSKGTGPGIVLTDEEKRLLEIENCVIPEDCGLTKDEEKILKKVRRKIKNKQSAMESRRRRKDYIENLERRVKNCTDVNNGLKKKVEDLTEDNKSLLKQLKQLQDIVATTMQQGRNTQKGTCLAMLVLSFAFFFLPLHQPFTKFGTTTAPESDTKVPMFRSRTLLHVDNGPEEYNSSKYEAPESDPYLLNSSAMFSEEVRANIEHLLLNEDNGLVKAKLDAYMDTIRSDPVGDPVNVLELREEEIPNNWRSDEM